MIDKKALRAKFLGTEGSLEYEITEQWLEDHVEFQMKQLAKSGKTEYDFVIHTNQVNPSMIRKVLSDRGYGILCWPEPKTSAPPYEKMRIKVLW